MMNGFFQKKMIHLNPGNSNIAKGNWITSSCWGFESLGFEQKDQNTWLKRFYADTCVIYSILLIEHITVLKNELCKIVK